LVRNSQGPADSFKERIIPTLEGPAPLSEGLPAAWGARRRGGVAGLEILVGIRLAASASTAHGCRMRWRVLRRRCVLVASTVLRGHASATSVQRNARVTSWTDRLEEGDHFRGNGVGGDDRGEVPDTRDLADASVDNVLGDVMR
jgi:hypothetical protein